MDDHDSLEQLGLSVVNFDEQNAALSEILNNGVEEALSTLSPAQLHQLEVNVKKLKMQAKTSSAAHQSSALLGSASSTASGAASHHHHSHAAATASHHHQMPLNEGGGSSGRSRSSSKKAAASASASSEQQLHALHPGQLLGLDAAAAAPSTSTSTSSSSKSASASSHHHHPSSNLPASCPILEIRDGNEYLIFTYSTKGQLQEFAIKTEIDNIGLEEIAEDFKAENCVYPRAFCSKEQYVGNRWEYETACNELAWKLSWINSEILAGKRGLIQRAVDSYRNRLTEMRSRRVVRQEKLTNGTLRRRTADGGYEEVAFEGENIYNLAGGLSPASAQGMLYGGGSASSLGKSGQFSAGSSANSSGKSSASSLGGHPHYHSGGLYAGSGAWAATASSSHHHPHSSAAHQITIPYGGAKGESKKMKLRIDIENVNDAEVDERFKQENSIYPDAEVTDAMGARRDYELESNEIAWKLAWINEEKLIGNRLLLQKAVDTYRAHLLEQQQQQQASQLSNAASAGIARRGGPMGSASLSYLDQLASAHVQAAAAVASSTVGGGSGTGAGNGGSGGEFECQKQEEFSAMVVNTLQQALSHHDLASDLNIVSEEGHGVYEPFHHSPHHHHHHLYEPSGHHYYH